MAVTPVEEVAPDRDIASREGLSTDQLTRSRLSYLIAQNNSLVQQTQFADAKAGALLAVVGLVATRGTGGGGLGLIPVETVAFFALHIAVLVACLIVLIPRFVGWEARRALARAELFSWPALVTENPAEDHFPGFMRTAQASQLVMSLARANRSLASILHRKFAWLRIAFLLATADLGLLAAAALFGFA